MTHPAFHAPHTPDTHDDRHTDRWPEATEEAIRMLGELVSFDTTSRNSNLGLLDHVEEYVSRFGGGCRRVYDEEGGKANLLIRVGPDAPGGIVLSGHTDVVPIDGQDWTTQPFLLTRQGSRLHGRGTSDMKAFIACSLVAARRAAAADLSRPLYLALSYDEEIGCFGAPAVIDLLRNEGAAVEAVIVGEPTGMKVVGAHKGIICYQVVVTGHEAHSSLTHRGLSANDIAVRLMSRLLAIADRLEAEADDASLFEPKQATLTIGLISGGTALNILAKRCEFTFDLRCRPTDDPDAILRPFLDEVVMVNAAVHEQFAGASVEAVRLVDVPPFGGAINAPAIELARSLTGDNGHDRVVPFGSEAGQFQVREFPTVICGPGSIEQAHQPDEFIEVSQIEQCMAFLGKLVERLTV